MGSVGLTILLADGSGNPAFLGQLIQSVVAESEDGQPGIDGYRTVNVVLVAHGSPQCEAAKQHALEVAPELLALADWPLNDSPPAECLGGYPATVAEADDAPLVVVNIPELPPVVSVFASGTGSPQQLAGNSSAPPVAADDPREPLGQTLAALDAASLDEVRGGFELGSTGLRFSFGIERAVYINGELVASTVLNLKDLQLAAGAGVPANVADAAGGLGIIQVGTGNNVTTQISPNMIGTIVQNTLNDQKIQNVTTINATVNSLQTVRAMSVQTAIHNGIVSSLRR
jgi:hypothetical protein